MRITSRHLRQIIREELSNLKESQPQAGPKPLSRGFYMAKKNVGSPEMSVDELEGAELPSMPLSKIDLTYDEGDFRELNDDYTEFDERVEEAFRQTSSDVLKGLVKIHGKRVPYTLRISRYRLGEDTENRYTARLDLGSGRRVLSEEDRYSPHFALKQVIELAGLIPKDVVDL